MLSSVEIAEWYQCLNTLLLADQQKLKRQFHQLLQHKNEPAIFEKKFQHFRDVVNVALQKTSQRRINIDKITFSQELPITQKIPEIIEKLNQHSVIIVTGETGSGKSTQLPKACLAAGFGKKGFIGHTQPRRLAAKSIAARLAEELQTTVGDQIGYQVRFSEKVSASSLIKVMTDGILLNEVHLDRDLLHYEVIIIDEVHERSLNIDFLLGYLKQLLNRRDNLKIIITSATIDVEKWSRFFSDAPIISVSGKSFPVEVWYRPLEALTSSGEQSDGIVAALQEIFQYEKAQHKTMSGDILIFLSGEREIYDLAKTLRHTMPPHLDVLPLYARLSLSEQQKVFKPGVKRRIILATNVAETSITVPRIHYVIDTGLARISRYSHRARVQQLPIEAISQASANQRMGRCGRIAPGICVRLYSEADFKQRSLYTPPEILRTNLAAVILKLLYLKLGNLAGFPFLDQPKTTLINDGMRLLYELQAIDANQHLTTLGKQLAQFPIDPRLARILSAAHQNHALSEILIIVSGLSIQDPREWPKDCLQKADSLHRQHYHKKSDFLTLVNLWNFFKVNKEELSQRRLREWCQKHFLSYLRLQEWQDIYRQLKTVCLEANMTLNSEPSSYAAVHRALLTGLLSFIAEKNEKKDYQSSHQKIFQLHALSTLAKATPKWIVVGEIMETQKALARFSAEIDVAWIENLSKHLLKKKYFSPQWDAERGFVMAYEQVNLYGLTIVPKRRVHYSRVDEKEAHKIFIFDAIVKNQLKKSPAFVQKNQAVIDAVRYWEEKIRRRDLLISDEQQAVWYAQRIPVNISSEKALNDWYQQLPIVEKERLAWDIDEIVLDSFYHIEKSAYPDVWQWRDIKLPLTYRFAVGEADDGISVKIPLEILPQLKPEPFEWLVPGYYREKFLALLKSLSKEKRKQLSFMQALVEEFLTTEKIDRLFQESVALKSALTTFIEKKYAISIKPKEWGEIDINLLMNFQLIHSQSEILDASRDFLELQKKYAEVKTSRNTLEKSNQKRYHDWEFPDLVVEKREISPGILADYYPYLLDIGDAVILQHTFDPKVAESAMKQAILRLLLINLASTLSYLRKEILRNQSLILLYSTFGDKNELCDDIFQSVICSAMSLRGISKTKSAFLALVLHLKQHIVSDVNELLSLLREVLGSATQLRKKIDTLPVASACFTDLNHQLQTLFPQHFLQVIQLINLKDYPRYLEAINLRLQKFIENPRNDQSLQEKLNLVMGKYYHLTQQNNIPRDKLEEFRWMLQEYRVSMFAQSLGTRIPISEKRLLKFLEKIGE